MTKPIFPTPRERGLYLLSWERNSYRGHDLEEWIQEAGQAGDMETCDLIRRVMDDPTDSEPRDRLDALLAELGEDIADL